MKLVTGATGFLGSAFVRALSAQNIAVRGVSLRRCPQAEIHSAEYVSENLCQVDPENDIFDSVDTIVHLASTTIPATSMADMGLDVRSNLEMALRLLEAARVRGIKNFVFASSGGTVYGDPVRLPAREIDPTDPRSSYGIVKLAIEKYINLYSRLHGMRGISLRISNPYGTGQLSGTPIGLIARLLQDVHESKRSTVWGDGSAVRDYFHIDDLTRAFLITMTTDLAAGVYNVGSGHGTSIKEIVALVQDITGQRVAVDYEPTRSVDVSKIWLDTEKFRTATGWQPTIALEAGMHVLWQDIFQRRPTN